MLHECQSNLSFFERRFLPILLFFLLFSYSFSNPWPSEISFSVLVTTFFYCLVLFALLVFYLKKLFVLFFIAFSLFFLLIGSSNVSLIRVFVDFFTFYYFIFAFLLFFYFTRVVNVDSVSDGKFFKHYFFSFLFFSFVYVFRVYYGFFESLDYNVFLVFSSHLEPHVEYLFLEPLFVFTALMSLYYAFYGTFVFSRFFYFIFSLVIISAPVVAGMRYVAMSYFIYLFVLSFSRFGKFFSLILFFSIFFASLYFGVFDFLISKTENHGNNGKIEDFVAVVDAVVSSSDYGFIFGMGFGSSYISEVLGSISSSYTHNIFSYAFLKGGIFLSVVAAFWFLFFLFFLYSSLIASFRSKEYFIFFFLLAYFLVFIMSTLVQPGYRTIGFSLLTGFALFLMFKIDRRKNENINCFH